VIVKVLGKGKKMMDIVNVDMGIAYTQDFNEKAHWPGRSD
jgi:hypothetical protein